MKMNQPTMHSKKIFVALFLIIFGSLGRLLLLGLPNVETLTVSTLLAGSLLGGLYSVFVPLAIVVLTDFLIGNNSILFFTWSAWILIGVFGAISGIKTQSVARSVGKLTILGLASSLFFYVYTNLGVWLLWDLYPHNFIGLVQCYLMGLPFLRMSIIGNLIIVPLVSLVAMLGKKYEQQLIFFLNNAQKEFCRKRLE